MVSGPVPPSKCKEFRQKVRDGEETISSLTEDEKWAHVTIYKHVAGDCNHSIDEKPLNRDERNHEIKISSDDCIDIRQLANKYPSINFSGIAETYGVDSCSILHHVYGDCKCEHNIDALEKPEQPTKVTKEECENIRRKYKETQVLQHTASELERDYTTVRYHVMGICSHDVDNIKTYSSRTIYDEQCNKIREKLVSGKSKEEICDQMDISENSVDYHRLGDCNHDTDSEILIVRDHNTLSSKRTRATKGECYRIQELYHKENKHVETISELSGLTKKVIEYHALNNCSHQFDEDVEYILV